VSGIEALDDATARRIRAMWATLAGAEAFPEAGVQVVVNRASGICPSGWAGIVAIGEGILATVPSDTEVDALARVLAGIDPTGDWAAAFRAAPEVRGPAYLAYADGPGVPPPVPGEIEMLAAGDAAVRAFVEGVPVVDREEAPVDASTSPLACLREGGAVVAAAGYRVWLDDVAHMAVLVDPAHRGRALATAVAYTATEHACAHGLVSQWRARPLASRAVARKLGYRDVGQQISVRLA